MRRIKIIAAVILGILVLGILTAVLLLNIYKKELLMAISDNVKLSYGLDIKIKDIQFSYFSSWPEATIQLKHVELSSTLTKGPKETFLEAGSIYLSFNLRKLIHKQLSVKNVSVKNARILLRKKKDGSTNFEFIAQKKDTLKKPSNVNFDIKGISLKNTGFTFVNEERAQRINFTFDNTVIKLNKQVEGFQASIKGGLKIGGLLFKLKKGPFFKNALVDLNLQIIFMKATKTLCICPPSYVRIENIDYQTTCLMEFGDKKRIIIMAKCEKADVFKASKLLNYNIQKILSNFHVEKPVAADVLIGIKLGVKQDPIVIVNVIADRNSINIGSSKVPYNEVSFKTRIVSITKDMESGDEDHGLIKVEQLRGKIYDFPFTASVAVVGFQHGRLDVKANLLLEGEKVTFELAKKFNLKGQCLANLQLSGPTDKLNKNEFLGTDMTLKANLQFKNFSLQSKKSSFIFALNGKAVLNKQDLSFQNFIFRSNGGSTVLNGKVENFTSYALGLNNYLKATLDARTTKFNLNPYFVKNVSSMPKQPKEAGDKAKAASSRKRKLEGDNINIHLRVFAKSLLVKKMEATQAEIVMDYTNNTLYLHSIKMNVCQGKLKANGMIENLQKLRSQIEIKEVNVSQLFKQMDNFGMDAIKSENLSGRLHLNATYSADLDEERNILPSTMQGEVKLKLTDGHLINFEPMQNISNYVFRNRDFNDIYFSEIDEQFQLKGYAMKIEEMELASNVINMYISGVYNMMGNSNINILIPWSNLKHRGKDYVVKASGESAEDTKGLKLNYSGTAKKMKLGMGHKQSQFD